MREKIIKNICIGHKKLDFQLNFEYLHLSPNLIGVDNEILISDKRFGSEIDGQSLSEYSQLIGLAEMIKYGDINLDYLYLFQYRKFISPINGGLDSIASWIKILTPDMVKLFFPSQEILEKQREKLITGAIFDFGESNVSMYSKTHVLEDFIMFVACCKENGFDNDYLRFFTMMTGIIPSPTLTFISAELFIKHIEILKQVGMSYLMNFHVKRTGYQSRSIGYLLERLHSKIIYDELCGGNISNIPVWNRYVVNKDL